MTHKVSYFNTPDGLKIAYREFGTYNPKRPTIICLAGLTRNSRSFITYAHYLQTQHDLHIICPDMRGRGLSEYDCSSLSYTVQTEAEDFLYLIDSHLNLENLIILGTSRGGMQAAYMAISLRDRLKGVILNDIGATIPITGLERLELLFQRTDLCVGDYDAALKSFYHLDHNMSQNLSATQEQEIINSIFKFENGTYHIDYDLEGLKLSYETMMNAITFTKQDKLDLSALFVNLKDTLCLLLHGVNSDILQTENIQDTQEIIPNIKIYSCTGRGHVLYMHEPEVIKACDRFLKRII